MCWCSVKKKGIQRWQPPLPLAHQPTPLTLKHALFCKSTILAHRVFRRSFRRREGGFLDPPGFPPRASREPLKPSRGREVFRAWNTLPLRRPPRETSSPTLRPCPSHVRLVGARTEDAHNASFFPSPSPFFLSPQPPCARVYSLCASAWVMRRAMRRPSATRAPLRGRFFGLRRLKTSAARWRCASLPCPRERATASRHGRCVRHSVMLILTLVGCQQTRTRRNLCLSPCASKPTARCSRATRSVRCASSATGRIAG